MRLGLPFERGVGPRSPRAGVVGGGYGLANRHDPLYWRLLRLRRLRPRPAVTFLLFEGSILVAALLAMAEIVSGWGAAAIPVAVALMVKLNDVIASTLDLRPLAEAQLRTPRPRDGRRLGLSRVPRVARVTTRIDPDDAVADPAAQPDRAGIARGVAAVPTRRPMPNSQAPETPAPDGSAESAIGPERPTGYSAFGATAPAGAWPEDRPAEESAEEQPVAPPSDRPNRGNQGRFAF